MAPQMTLTATESPPFKRPYAAKAWLPPVGTLALAGVTCSSDSARTRTTALPVIAELWALGTGPLEAVAVVAGCASVAWT